MKKSRRTYMYPIGLMGILLISCYSCTKEISPKDVVINWENPQSITVGTPLTITQLNATSEIPGEFVYKPPLGTVLNAGDNQILRVYFTPKDDVNYKFANKAVMINVTKNVPVITWNDPADIFYGTILSQTQLNATTNVRGTFVYTPPIGTKLKTGANQDLSVNFIPLDTAAAVFMSKKVKINVNPTITVKDMDGNMYHTVVVGTQLWMKENLKTTKYNDGTPIPLKTDGAAWSNSNISGYCWYNNDSVSFKAYGALYNWKTIETGKLCPSGWHVSTNDEWSTLISFLYNSGWKTAKALADSIGWANSETIYTVGNNQLSNNQSEFTAIPGGSRSTNGTFNGIGNYTRWWTSTRSSMTQANIIEINSKESAVFFYQFSDLANGYSIRCVKD